MEALEVEGGGGACWVAEMGVSTSVLSGRQWRCVRATKPTTGRSSSRGVMPEQRGGMD